LGDDEDGSIDGPDGVASSRNVGALASIIFPTTHKIQNDDRLPQHVSGVSGWMSLLLPAHLGSPRQRAAKKGKLENVEIIKDLRLYYDSYSLFEKQITDKIAKAYGNFRFNQEKVYWRI